jgi:hypothetical protein
MADDDNFGAVGIACTTCKHRAVLRLHYGPDEINGRPLPLTGQQGQNCRSTTLAWRRFATLAEADAWRSADSG